MLLSTSNRNIFWNVQCFAFVACLLGFPVAGMPTTAVNTSSSSISPATNHTYDYSTTFDDDELSRINIASMTVDAVGMLCNTLLILLITVDPLRILRKGAWVTILNLSVADFLACLSHFVRVFLSHTEKYEEYELLLEEFSFIWKFGVGASFMLLTLLTAQMYIIIKNPMKSRTLTGSKAVLACLAVWAFAFPLGLSEIAYVWMQRIEVLYFYVANIAVLELAVAIQVVLKILIVKKLIESRHDSVSDESQDQKQKDVAKTVIILIIIQIVTALPFFVALQISFLSRLGHLGEDPLLRKFRYYYEPIGLLNFVANPILYSLRLQDYRRSLVAVFLCKCEDENDSSVPMVSIESNLLSTATENESTQL